tara:strand:- start:16696 stop:17109 length:414 start_codon:yes stop_codon:yes gene_type:complete
MTIHYKLNAAITTDQFIELLNNSTLGERRPVEDRDCMEGMIANSNLTITAWDGDTLVGIARSMTDFHYACYLSDLAVSKTHQRKGIGKQLLTSSQQQLGPKCKLILIAAPAANDYYQPFGFNHNDRCWILEPNIHIN